MFELIDHKIKDYFQPECLQTAFKQYEAAKQDYFEPSVVNIPTGADGISYKTFKNELEQRCEFISHRVLKGTYQFYPFREVSIQKPSGGERVYQLQLLEMYLFKRFYMRLCMMKLRRNLVQHLN